MAEFCVQLSLLWGPNRPSVRHTHTRRTIKVPSGNKKRISCWPCLWLTTGHKFEQTYWMFLPREYTNWNLTYTTEQGSRVNWIAQSGFAALGKMLQQITASPQDETEQLSPLAVANGICHLMMISNPIWTKATEGKALLSREHQSWLWPG